jgi:uroporphyrinogen decarboxylase
MAEMTSRERMWAAINHQEPDRVPLDIGGGISTTIVIEAYDNLKRYLGIPGDTAVMNNIYRLARLDEDVMRRLGSDTRPVTLKGPTNWKPPRTDNPDQFTDLWGITYQKANYPGGYYWELRKSPLAEATIDDLEKYAWPDPLDPGFTMGLEDEVKNLFENTDYALMADPGFKGFWQHGCNLRGFNQMLIDLVDNPEFVIALMEKLLEINIAGTRRFLDIVGKYIQIFRTGDDLATQNSLLMSPRTYRHVLKPTYKKYLDFVHSNTDAKIFYHSCGKVTGLLDDLIEIGVDIINPVQVSAMGDTGALKERFKNRLVFWGGIDTQHILPYGSIEEVEAEVKLRIQDLGPGGGYVAGAVHNIQSDVSPQNILAMAEATHKYGKYPLSGKSLSGSQKG